MTTRARGDIARRQPRARRGSALVAALATIAVLASVTAITSRRARERADVTRNAEALVVARAMAESGVLAARAAIEGALANAGADAGNDAGNDRGARRRVLDAVFAPDGGGPFVDDTLGVGRFAVAADNVQARLDLNRTDDEALARLFSRVMAADDAQRIAARLAGHVRGTAAGDGRQRPFASLDEVEALLGPADAARLQAAAAWITVDGDGQVDRVGAPAAVREVATGGLIDLPTRLLLVSRGARIGHPLIREIQAVYAIEGDELRLVAWRERTR
ncbi:MAG: hypothetical protein LCH84_13695 [Gemmatimonadetes bacterium]|nr:hypothetical protein [Gemmatimonadota bacterium]